MKWNDNENEMNFMTYVCFKTEIANQIATTKEGDRYQTNDTN